MSISMVDMLTLLLFGLQALPDDGANLARTLNAIESISKVDCSDPSANCPNKDDKYRLPLSTEVEERRALDALNKDGSACAIIGQTICKGKTRPILRSNETPTETLNAAAGPN